MSHAFSTHARGLSSPAGQHFAIQPSDGADLPRRPRVIYCQTAGTAVLRCEAGVTLSYALVQGQILPLSPVRVLAAGTTATLFGWL
ncbi:hypothetical protein SAMN04488003_11849 [Loktanella fryxellensis]|uniref:Uncharacterized protein n=1 Tax=Loktanella fryxellensis TaxID=245187 RepID=A0A1H8H0Z0_9RHOB|nr:hypothetical protein [Loktanella fryxellensis]SEN49148.1 hypothetical protein SAMN04488003_11849 [Loktanella fryxellensis]